MLLMVSLAGVRSSEGPAAVTVVLHGDGRAAGDATSVLVEPWMPQDVRQADALVALDSQALTDEVLALDRQAYSESKPRPADLIVCLEWDVATHHVEEQDAKGPHRRLLTVVARVADPFWWGIDSRT